MSACAVRRAIACLELWIGCKRMALAWAGSVEAVSLQHVAEQRRAIRIRVHYRVFDDVTPGVTLHEARVQLAYPASVFNGMTPAQAFALIRDTGAAGTPSLRAIGNRLLTDYTRLQTLLGVPLPFNFTATTP